MEKAILIAIALQKGLVHCIVKIVTTDFHALRSRIIAKRHGYSNVDNYSSATKWYLIPISYVREGFAMVKTVLFDK